jgi:hypothetical protein
MSALGHTHPPRLRRADPPLPLPFLLGHGLNVCEVLVEIPFDPTAPWKGAVVGRDIDDTIEKMAHVALT